MNTIQTATITTFLLNWVLLLIALRSTPHAITKCRQHLACRSHCSGMLFLSVSVVFARTSTIKGEIEMRTKTIKPMSTPSRDTIRVNVSDLASSEGTDDAGKSDAPKPIILAQTTVSLIRLRYVFAIDHYVSCAHRHRARITIRTRNEQVPSFSYVVIHSKTKAMVEYS